MAPEGWGSVGRQTYPYYKIIRSNSKYAGYFRLFIWHITFKIITLAQVQNIKCKSICLDKDRNPQIPLLQVWRLQKSTWMFHSTCGKLSWTEQKQSVAGWKGHTRLQWRQKSPSQLKTHSKCLVCRRVSWFGTALLLQGLVTLRHSTEKWKVSRYGIFHEKWSPPFCMLKLNRGWVMQQDNDPNDWCKSATEWFHHMKIHLLGWPSQSPDHNPISLAWPQNSHSNKTFQEYCDTKTVL